MATSKKTAAEAEAAVAETVAAAAATEAAVAETVAAAAATEAAVAETVAAAAATEAENTETTETKTVTSDKVKIQLELTKENRGDVEVSVNGKVYQIKRGCVVEVPRAVYEVLENTKLMDQLAIQRMDAASKNFSK